MPINAAAFDAAAPAATAARRFEDAAIEAGTKGDFLAASEAFINAAGAWEEASDWLAVHDETAIMEVFRGEARRNRRRAEAAHNAAIAAATAA